MVGVHLAVQDMSVLLLFTQPGELDSKVSYTRRGVAAEDGSEARLAVCVDDCGAGAGVAEVVEQLSKHKYLLHAVHSSTDLSLACAKDCGSDLLGSPVHYSVVVSASSCQEDTNRGENNAHRKDDPIGV